MGAIGQLRSWGKCDFNLDFYKPLQLAFYFVVHMFSCSINYFAFQNFHCC